jgi:pimeloyl-ACP methyl ester carboxylesterase
VSAATNDPIRQERAMCARNGKLRAIAAAAMVGACIQSVPARGQTTVTTPPPLPGRLVDIGGYRLHLNCTGRGTPTVLLESGAGDFSFDWALVQRSIGELTRVCSYDRAGYAWSDPGPTPRTLEQLALEAHTLLERAGEATPGVMGGHSQGGLIVRAYASRYPREVAGMVLVDATHEDNEIMLNGEMKLLRSLSRHRPIPTPHVAKPDSAPRVADAPTAGDSVTAPYDRLPRSVQALRRWATAQPAYAAARSSEFDYLAEDVAQMHDARTSNRQSLGELPLVVLTRRTAPADFMKLQADLATLSMRGRHRITASEDHHIQLFDPGAVVDAVRTVVSEARARR